MKKLKVMNKKTAFSVGAKLFQKMAFIEVFSVINVLLVASVFWVVIVSERIIFGLNTQKANKIIFSLLRNMVVLLRPSSERLIRSDQIFDQPFQPVQMY